MSESATVNEGRNRAVDDIDPTHLLASALSLPREAQPFPWQIRLLDRFRQGDLPRSLDVPTGLGKTATIAIWLVARLLNAPVPRRLVYIVDRRAVVDQATDIAEGLRGWVAQDPAFPQRLGLGDRPLPVSTLRGKLVDNRQWLEDPAAPGIVIGTVDMIGSRLLFEGYRATRRIRPCLAGLLGHDSLFVLDEAHLVPPFERLLERIAFDSARFTGKSASLLADPAPLRLLSLSATGRSHGGAPFDLDSSDFANEEVARRLAAPKIVTRDELAETHDLATEAAERAWAMSQAAGEPRRYLIFLDRRKDAEKAHGTLRERAGLVKPKKGEVGKADVELLVGARRVYERQESARRLGNLGFLAGTKAPLERPAFLVATSAGEVGIDLDADDMIGDLVPWERLVQRLGRVNRRGRGQARIVLLDPPQESKTPNEVLARLAAVRDLLGELPHAFDKGRNASPGAIRDLTNAAREDDALADLIRRASTPAPLYPDLDRPTLDAWSMTSLETHPGRPAIAPWLRGWDEERPQIIIAWRRHLPVSSERTSERPRRAAADAWVKRYFEAAPLHASELLEADTYFATERISKLVSRLVKRAEKSESADPGLDDVVACLITPGGGGVRSFRLRELDVSKKELESIVVGGGQIIFDARVGGLTAGLLDESADTPVPAIEDGAWAETVAVPFSVRPAEPASDGSEPPATEEPGWAERARIPVDQSAEGEVSSWLIIDRRIDDAATEDDRSAGHPQTLANHQALAEEKAAELAARLQLSHEAEQVLRIAARLHDEGKRAARWQAAFRAPGKGSEVYAKTRGPINTRLLDGYRHEFGSLPYAEKDQDLTNLPADQRDLVLHLIASHHGYARPVISTRGCEDAPPSALRRRAREVALRFWRLQEQWGPWGLAWWEALLRAADQQASRENVMVGAKNEKEGA